MKTNQEAEVMLDMKKSWVFAYAEGSDFYIPNVLHIERNDDLMFVEDDDDACKEAEKEGVPLIYGLEGIPDGVYVDTEENRNIIAKMLILYPEYKKWGNDNV